MSKEFDVVIFGGGIAGLWTLAELRARGYQAILFEKDTLGGIQTIAAQGVIHAGLKYVINGKNNSTAQNLSVMPSRWKAALKGESKIKLTSTKVLSEKQHLWSEGSLLNIVSSFFASKALASSVKKLDRSSYPEILKNPKYRGTVYEIDEMVVDVPSLIENLYSENSDSIYKINWDIAKLNVENDLVKSLEIGAEKITAKLFVFAAGSGNKFLCSHFNESVFFPMQERPLHQVTVASDKLKDFYSVCMGNNILPPVIITTHRNKSGTPVWYLGGALATHGIERSKEDQIEFAKKELKRLLPWLDLSTATWDSFMIQRAEPKQSQSFLLPEGEFTEHKGNTMLVWPTKLVLAPAVADKVLAALADVLPNKSEIESLNLERPAVAKTFWY